MLSNHSEGKTENCIHVYCYVSKLVFYAQSTSAVIMHTNIIYSQTFRGEWIVQNYNSI